MSVINSAKINKIYSIKEFGSSSELIVKQNCLNTAAVVCSAIKHLAEKVISEVIKWEVRFPLIFIKSQEFADLQIRI